MVLFSGRGVAPLGRVYEAMRNRQTHTHTCFLRSLTQLNQNFIFVLLRMLAVIIQHYLNAYQQNLSLTSTWVSFVTRRPRDYDPNPYYPCFENRFLLFVQERLRLRCGTCVKECLRAGKGPGPRNSPTCWAILATVGRNAGS